MDMVLSENNVWIYAAKHYYSPKGIDADEFQEDLNRFKYVKRLINRYLETDNLSERLILNHLIVIFNVFGNEAALNILDMKMNRLHWTVLKPFLIFLRAIENDQYTDIPMDELVVEKLREIKKEGI